jgi:hypothetical protein
MMKKRQEEWMSARERIYLQIAERQGVLDVADEGLLQQYSAFEIEHHDV